MEDNNEEFTLFSTHLQTRSNNASLSLKAVNSARLYHDPINVTTWNHTAATSVSGLPATAFTILYHIHFSQTKAIDPLRNLLFSALAQYLAQSTELAVTTSGPWLYQIVAR